MRKLVLVLALAALAGVITATHAEARTVCADSNGSAPGGSVYVSYYTNPFPCDVVPPRRLHLTRTPSRAACLDAGGHSWTWTYRICWDVDY